MKKVRRLFKALLPRLLDVYVYRLSLTEPLQKVNASIQLDVEIKHDKHIYSFIGRHDGKVVNKIYVLTKNRLANQLGYSNAYILYNGETNEEYRGKGVQPFMLTAITKHLAAIREYNNICGFTLWNNYAMHRVFDKTGYKRLYRIKVYRLAGICLFKKKVRE